MVYRLSLDLIQQDPGHSPGDMHEATVRNLQSRYYLVFGNDFKGEAIFNLKTPYYISRGASQGSLDHEGVTQEESSWLPWIGHSGADLRCRGAQRENTDLS